VLLHMVATPLCRHAALYLHAAGEPPLGIVDPVQYSAGLVTGGSQHRQSGQCTRIAWLSTSLWVECRLVKYHGSLIIVRPYF
jgi:uncharacterized protein YbaR (Trm112 family)